MYFRNLNVIDMAGASPHITISRICSRIHALIHKKALQGKLHIAFPEYSDSKGWVYGNKVRLFADDKAVLDDPELVALFDNITDRVLIYPVMPVPEGAPAVYGFKRVQPKLNPYRIARRRSKRQGTSFDDAFEEVVTKGAMPDKPPFISMQTHSGVNNEPVVFKLHVVRITKEDDDNKSQGGYGFTGKLLPDF